MVATVLLSSLVLAATAEAAAPTLQTDASPGVVLGGSVFDSAVLAGASNPTGTITFSLFANDNATCAGPPVFTSTVPVAGNGTYDSASFTPAAVGLYEWVASYSGDANNSPAATVCGDLAETVFIFFPPPVSLTTQASPSPGPGGVIDDVATLSGGGNPTGTITFNLFGPNDPTCAGPLVFTSTVVVAGDGNYTSSPFTPGAPGTYRWQAVYSGDAVNAGVSTACNDPAESVTIGSASVPTITTTASNTSVGSGTDTTDTATLAGAINPTGTITFNLFGPGDPTCTGTPVFISVVPVTGNGSFQSTPFHAVPPGTYSWVASYSGDANNPPVTTSCGDPAESVIVSGFTVLFSTQASGPVPVGGTVTDTATILESNHATGAITFSLFGPDDANCAGPPVFTSPVLVDGDGNYTTPPFTPGAPGTYRWVAVYSGDVNNQSAGPTACGDPAETVVVTAPQMGFLTICKAKAGGAKGTYIFAVEGRTVPVAAGQCSAAIRLPAGDVTVTESPSIGFRLANCTTTPADRLVACNRSAGSAVVRVHAGGIAKQTIATFTNRAASGELKICKVAGNGVATGSRHVFRVNGQRVVVQAATGPGGGCALAGSFPVGTHVDVVERIADTERVSAIVVRPASRLVGAPDLGAGAVTVAIDRGVTEVGFTDVAR